MIRVQQEAFDVAAETASLLAKAPGSGALVTFVGVVRPLSGCGRLHWLELEQYPGLTEATIKGIGEDAMARFALVDLAIIHRFGRLAPGEGIVFVGAASAHRRSAFDATDYVMDRLKIEALFWKKEVGADFANWIDPSPSDAVDRLRWANELQK